MGNNLFSGDYRSEWEFYKPAQRLAMTSCLAELKGSDNLPRGTVGPFITEGLLLKHLISEVVEESVSNHEAVKNTVFNRTYDFIIPLPSSKGRASSSNLVAANTIASGFSATERTPKLVHGIKRFVPMTTKSTKTIRTIRSDEDAPRLMHFNSMCIDEDFFDAVKGSSILLYDDVETRLKQRVIS